jgi:hypothetical protein
MQNERQQKDDKDGILFDLTDKTSSPAGKLALFLETQVSHQSLALKRVRECLTMLS